MALLTKSVTKAFEKETKMNKSLYRLSEDDVKKIILKLQESQKIPTTYLRIGWSDLHGIVRGVTVPARHMHSFLGNGYSGFAGMFVHTAYIYICTSTVQYMG